MREDEVRVAAARGRRELDAVFRLRYEAYLRKGYVPSHPSRTMRDEWDGLPGTMHFAALQGKNLVGAIRLVLDSAHGLPMERVFAEEIDTLRCQGRKLAEASALVVADDARGPGRRLWLALSRAVWQESEARGIEDLVIAVTPNHLAFYERLLFERMGVARRYQSLNGILAYPMRLQTKDARERHRLHVASPNGLLQRRFLGDQE